MEEKLAEPVEEEDPDNPWAGIKDDLPPPFPCEVLSHTLEPEVSDDESQESKPKKYVTWEEPRKKPKYHLTEFQIKQRFHFVNKLHDTMVAPGKTIFLSSIISSIGPIEVEWRLNGRLLHNTSRKELFFQRHRNVASIEIQNARGIDSGKYTITAISEICGSITDECEVVVKVPVKETADQPPTFTRIITGIRFYKCMNLNKKFFGIKL